MVNKGEKFIVVIQVEAPATAGDRDFREWVSYELGEQSTLAVDNPLGEYELTAEVLGQIGSLTGN